VTNYHLLWGSPAIHSLFKSGEKDFDSLKNEAAAEQKKRLGVGEEKKKGSLSPRIVKNLPNTTWNRKGEDQPYGGPWTKKVLGNGHAGTTQTREALQPAGLKKTLEKDPNAPRGGQYYLDP